MQSSPNQLFIKRIDTIIKSYGVKKKTISEKAGIGYNRLSNILNGRSLANFEDLNKLDKAFPDQSDTTIKNATPEQLKEIAILEERIKDLLSEKEYDKKTIDRLNKTHRQGLKFQVTQTKSKIC